MVGRLIVSLLWLTFVHSDTLEGASMNPSAVKMPMGMKAAEDPSSGEPMSVKSKRYLSHHHSSPCPPFYPHFGMHMPMHDMRPYGPPAYPKNDVHPMMHSLQYVHQPTYTSYVPKQTIQYIKPEIKAPIYQHPVVNPPIHQLQPVHHVVKEPPPMPNYYHHYQPPMYPHKIAYPKQPIFSYAPAYHKPMPMIWPATQIKKYELPTNHIQYSHQPAIVYKPEQPKCAPCPPPQPIHPPPTYVKILQPSPHPPVQHSPPMFYLPAASHQPVVKACK